MKRKKLQNSVKKCAEKSYNSAIRLYKIIFDKENVRDYIVIIMIISFIYFIAKGIEVPDVFYALLGTAVGYYFKGNGK